MKVEKEIKKQKRIQRRKRRRIVIQNIKTIKKSIIRMMAKGKEKTVTLPYIIEGESFGCVDSIAYALMMMERNLKSKALE